MVNALIVVASHKTCAFPNIPYHIPICVGAYKNREKYNWPDGTIFDDMSDDNISNLNSAYNELTGHYYIWKNMKGYDYYGLCHYRRYFNFEAKPSKYPRIPVSFSYKIKGNKFNWNEKTINALLEQYDIVLARKEIDTPPEYNSLAEAYKIEGWQDIMLSCINELYPDYLKYAQKYLSQNKKSMFNMFIMRKDLFEAYSEWLFSILDLYEKKLTDRKVSSLDRSAGRLGEHLLNIFVMQIEDKCQIRIAYLQTLMVNETGIHPSFNEKIKAIIKTLFGVFFPYSSKRRDKIKWKYFMKGHYIRY